MFDEPLRIARLLSNYEGIWMIAGGWAIDLFLNRETRTHQDIEIAIPRKEQFLLLAYLQNWTFQYAHSGELYKWKKDHYLQLPIHEVHGS